MHQIGQFPPSGLPAGSQYLPDGQIILPNGQIITRQGELNSHFRNDHAFHFSLPFMFIGVVPGVPTTSGLPAGAQYLPNGQILLPNGQVISGELHVNGNFTD